MITLAKRVLAREVWFDEDNLWVLLTDGRQIAVPLIYFPRLLHASREDPDDYIISGGGTGIHWDKLDEDISVEGLLLRLFIAHSCKKNMDLKFPGLPVDNH